MQGLYLYKNLGKSLLDGNLEQQPVNLESIQAEPIHTMNQNLFRQEKNLGSFERVFLLYFHLSYGLVNWGNAS